MTISNYNQENEIYKDFGFYYNDGLTSKQREVKGMRTILKFQYKAKKFIRDYCNDKLSLITNTLGLLFLMKGFF